LFTTELRGASSHPDWHTLPALLVSADDPASGFLASLAAGAQDAGALVDALGQAPERTLEVELRQARALIEASRLDDAERVLSAIEVDDEWEWRVAWYRGLMRLSSDDPNGALEEFQTVYRSIPGELAVKLALAYAAECAGRLEAAGGWYDIVSRTDPSFTSAAFGLARCRLALADRAGAVAAYDRVPEASSAYVDAQIAKAENMLDGAGPVAVADVVGAGAVVDRLPLGGEARARLTTRVLAAALPLVSANGTGDGATLVLGHPLTEEAVRRALEAAYRALARHSQAVEERIELIDQANQVRPRTLV
jgi:serine/threonine-protein kinase PknG